MHGLHPLVDDAMPPRPRGTRGVARPDEPALSGSVVPAREAREAHAALWETVRDAAEVLARELRADAVPPERMLVLVKAAAQRAAPATLDPLERGELVSDAVRWGVAAYYAT